MKKNLWLFVLLFLTMGWGGAKADSNGVQDTMTYVPDSKSSFNIYPFYICVGFGAAPIASGFNSIGNPWLDNGSATFAGGYGTSYSAGLGGEVIVGLDLNEHWSVALNCDLFSFNTPKANFNSLQTNLFPTIRYTFDRSKATPYVMAGAGLNTNTDFYPLSLNFNPGIDGAPNYYINTNALWSDNLVLTAGVGLLFNSPWETGSDDIYVQAQYDEVITQQGSYSYFPLTVGYRYQGPH
jgi:hypothetical protein